MAWHSLFDNNAMLAGFIQNHFDKFVAVSHFEVRIIQNNVASHINVSVFSISNRYFM